jgi:hypothetical protein
MFTGSASITPGLSHDQTAQTDLSGTASLDRCANSETGGVVFGSAHGLGTITSYPGRPLGCSPVDGGAGPDYPDQTPVLLGPDPSFSITWGLGGTSTGVVKAKARGPALPHASRVVLIITAGKFVAGGPEDPNPGAHSRAKIKGTVDSGPTDTYSCMDNSDPISEAHFFNVSNFILKYV